ncbi:targeting protein for Xklp2-like [Phlebotomus argentipes]|uniref:targeting protein for Xklp2-like n=1 Tax=Phlebotomus argentipes TaxID=94469 RepID=UPI00289334CE|nr:targeting protein for Xklp2-like [Phlebotomus argentipes]
MPFDWDNIDCASPNLENSAYFFLVPHPGHEKEAFNEQLEDFKENTAPQNEEKPKESPIIVEKLKKKVPLQTRVNNAKVAPKDFTKAVKKHNENLKKPPPQIAGAKDKAKTLTFRVNRVAVVPVRKEPPRDVKVPDFRAKPAPNFKRLHEMQKKIVKQKTVVTVPQTPTVLKKSQALLRNKAETERTVKPKIVIRKDPPRTAQALGKQPWVPKKERKLTQVVPFNLQTTKRQEERRRFDELSRQIREVKIKKEQDQRKKEEEEMRKQLRKRTEFRARPNPFK